MTMPSRKTMAVILGALAVCAVVVGVLLAAAGGGGDTDLDPEEGRRPSSSIPAGELSAAESELLTPWEPECPAADGSSERHLRFTEPPPMCIDPEKGYQATVETSRGTIVIELDATNAPTAVNNFVFLAGWHYYDGVTFDQVVEGVAAHVGDPISDPPEAAGPGYAFADELPSDEPYYPKYSVAMHNAGVPDSNDSLFFIATGDDVDRPPANTRFGAVVEGQSVVDAIDATAAEDGGAPRQPTTIERITITES